MAYVSESRGAFGWFDGVFVVLVLLMSSVGHVGISFTAVVAHLTAEGDQVAQQWLAVW